MVPVLDEKVAVFVVANSVWGCEDASRDVLDGSLECDPLFFDWVVQNTGKTMFSAMVIALSQILLVDFNYVLIGRRELMPALISVGTLLVIWTAVSFVYDKLGSETP